MVLVLRRRYPVPVLVFIQLVASGVLEHTLELLDDAHRRLGEDAVMRSRLTLSRVDTARSA